MGASRPARFLPRAAFAALLLAAAWAACGAPKAVFKGIGATEVGTDGWWKSNVTPGLVEAVRNTQRVVIAIGTVPDTYIVRIDPKSLVFVTPPWGDTLVASEGKGISGEHRTYRIPPGRTWNDVHDWYVKSRIQPAAFSASVRVLTLGMADVGCPSPSAAEAVPAARPAASPSGSSVRLQQALVRMVPLPGGTRRKGRKDTTRPRS